MSDPISLYPDSWVIEYKEMTPLSSTSHVWYSNLIPSYRIPSHWSQKRQHPSLCLFPLYMQCYGNDDHLASWLTADSCSIQGDRSMNNSTSAIQHILAGFKLQFCLLAEMLLFLFLSVPVQVSCMIFHSRSYLLLLIMAKPSISYYFPYRWVHNVLTHGYRLQFQS